jgi:hypothetical protein
VPEVYCPAITDHLKLMYSVPHKITIFWAYFSASSCVVLYKAFSALVLMESNLYLYLNRYRLSEKLLYRVLKKWRNNQTTPLCTIQGHPLSMGKMLKKLSRDYLKIWRLQNRYLKLLIINQFLIFQQLL